MSYSSTILATTGLTNYWQLSESSGTTATAAFGGVNGTYAASGVSYLVAGPVGVTPDTAVTLDGTNGYGTGGACGNFSGTQSMTGEIWVYITANPLAQQRLLYHASTATNLPGWGMSIDTAGKITIWRSDGTGATNSFGSNTGISFNTWHHAVVVFDGSLGGIANLTVWVDGSLGTSAVNSTLSLPSDATTTLGFGVRTADLSAKFLGSLAEPAIYNVALSSATISAHYSAGTTAQTQQSLPASDLSVGTWTTNTGATSNLYQVIDETTANDADYIQSVAGP